MDYYIVFLCSQSQLFLTAVSYFYVCYLLLFWPFFSVQVFILYFMHTADAYEIFVMLLFSFGSSAVFFL